MTALNKGTVHYGKLSMKLNGHILKIECGILTWLNNFKVIWDEYRLSQIFPPQLCKTGARNAF